MRNLAQAAALGLFAAVGLNALPDGVVPDFARTPELWAEVNARAAAYPASAWALGGLAFGLLFWPAAVGGRLADRVVSGYVGALVLGLVAASAWSDNPVLTVWGVAAAALAHAPWLTGPCGAAVGRLVVQTWSKS